VCVSLLSVTLSVSPPVYLPTRDCCSARFLALSQRCFGSLSSVVVCATVAVAAVAVFFLDFCFLSDSVVFVSLSGLLLLFFLFL
jgi:hypothetical protein